MKTREEEAEAEKRAKNELSSVVEACFRLYCGDNAG